MVNSSSGCNTFYTGIPSNLINCLNICLVDLKGEKVSISISTIKDSFDLVKNKVYVSREDTESPFSIEISKLSDLDGFDTIFYLTRAGYPIGYSKFDNKQVFSKELTAEKVSVTGKIDLYVVFTSDIDDVIETELYLTNDLSGISSDTSLTDKNMFKNEDYDYTNKERLDDTINNLDKYVRYTNNVSSIISSKNFGLLTDTLFLNGDTIYKSAINNNTSLFSYFTEFNNWSVGSWKGNILLYRWNDENKFLVSSLTEYNKFGKATEYFNNNSNKIQQLPEGFTVKYMTGKYAVLEDKDENLCFQDLTDLSSNVEYTGSYGFYIDTYDSDSNVQFFDTRTDLIGSITNEKTKHDIYSFCQSPYKDSTLNKNWKLYKKIGPWYVLKKNNSDGSLLYINENGSLYTSIFENILVVSSRCLLLSVKNSWFLFFFENGNTMETAGYSYIKDNKKGVFEVGQKYVDSKLKCQYDQFENSGYLVHLTSARNQIIDGLRHSYLRNFDLPEIKISYMGYLFYEENNVLKYL